MLRAATLVALISVTIAVTIAVAALPVGAPRVAQAADDDWPAAAKSPADVKPGQTRVLAGEGGMTWLLRVPKSYDAKKGARLVVWMHGSNMNGRAYVGSFEAKHWCDDDLLLCPNGETTADAAKHVHNFTELSGPLVADAVRATKKAFRVTATYVGGHSQGAFLTLNVFLCHPDEFQGAISFAGGCWMRNEPDLWLDQPDVLAKQMRIPLAVIHGPDDPVVPFATGKDVYDRFRSMGWPALRLFAPDGIGHMFMPAPVDEAIAWLDAMNGRDEKRSAALVDDWIAAGEWSWAAGAADALADAPGAGAAAKALPAKVAKAADAPAKKAVAEMQTAMDREPAIQWVPKWLEFRRVFWRTAAAKPLVAKYDRLRDREQGDGARIFGEVIAAFRSNREDDAWAAYERLLEEAPHSYHAWFAAVRLTERGAKPSAKGGKKK